MYCNALSQLQQLIKLYRLNGSLQLNYRLKFLKFMEDIYISHLPLWKLRCDTVLNRCFCRGGLTNKFQPRRFLKSRFLPAGQVILLGHAENKPKLLQLTSLSTPTCIRTAKFVRWLQVHVISVLVLLTTEHPLLDQEPLAFDLKYSFVVV